MKMQTRLPRYIYMYIYILKERDYLLVSNQCAIPSCVCLAVLGCKILIHSTSLQVCQLSALYNKTHTQYFQRLFCIGMAFGPKDNGVIADASLRAASRFHSAVSNPPLHILPPTLGTSYSKIRFVPSKNDLGLVNGWVDAMKACSPPHSRCLKGDPFDKAVIDLQYRNWMVSFMAFVRVLICLQS